MSTSIDTPVLTVTDDALETILGLRAAEEDGDTLALRVEITGSRGADYTYDLAFEPLAEAAEDDAVYQQGDLSVWIPAESVENLMGATLDLPGVPGQGGLVLRNPNRPDPLAASPFVGGDIELTGDTAEKIRQLLDAAGQPGAGQPRRLRHADRRRRRQGDRRDGRRLPGLRGQRHDPARRHRAGHQGPRAGDHRGGRRHRPRVRREPLLHLSSTLSSPAAMQADAERGWPPRRPPGCGAGARGGRARRGAR